MTSKRTRPALGAALTLALGLTLTPLGCESWDRPAFTHIHPLPESAQEDPAVPESIVQQLTRCAEQAPGRSTSGKPESRAVQFTVHAAQDGRVSDVDLNGSTLGEPAVETCMQGALQGMALAMYDAPLRISPVASGRGLTPEYRALDAFPLPPLTIIALHPVVVVVAGLIVLVVIYVVSEPIVKAILAPAKAAPVAAPAATAAPAAPAARRNANQTCEDKVLDALEAEKTRLCSGGVGAKCAEGTNDKKRTRIPCSAIKDSLKKRKACRDQRILIQNECFGGRPDAGHKETIDNYQRGINGCEELKETNCAEGHPMANL